MFICIYRGIYIFIYIIFSMFLYLRWRFYICSIFINDLLSNKIFFIFFERKEYEAVKEKKEEKYIGIW